MGDEELVVQEEQQQDQQPVEHQEQQPSEISPAEQLARDHGWVSKEEWKGNPEDWRPAREFNERGELFAKIDTVGRELKETRKALQMLQKHHGQVKEVEYNRAIAELKAKQKQHLEEGNSDGYLETTELLTDIRAEQKAREAVAQAVPSGPDPRFLSWASRNDWYAKDKEMHEYADAVGLGYAQQNPSLAPEEVLEYVTTQVKARFRERFVNPNRNKPSAVEGSGTNTPQKKATIELTSEERKVMNAFVRTGAMTAEEYLSDLKKIRGIK
jgi:tellurite resistance protein